MKKFKNIGEWILAAICAFLLSNILCFMYERPVAWIDRNEGVTEGVRRPYSILIHGTEGYGVTKLDENGFTNENKKLIDKDYILVMGSSHTQGKEISPNEKYTYILNKMISNGDNDNLYVYNIASDGNFLPSLLQRFPAGIEEFANSKMVIIEIGNTDFSVDELRESLNQKHFNQDVTTKELFENAGNLTRIKNCIKEYFPLISLYKSNLETLQNNNTESNLKNEEFNEAEYSQIMDELLKTIRNQYDKRIILVYHPDISIGDEGKLDIHKSDTYDTFSNLANKNNIDLIDLSEAFLEHYNEYSEVPYGFWNTQMGSGHLNKIGHEIIAEEIYEYIKELD